MTKGYSKNLLKNKSLLLSILLLCAVLSATSQDASKKDSAITLKEIAIKPTTDFDQRFSYIDGQMINIWGYRIGVVVHDKFKIGIGGYYFDQTGMGVQSSNSKMTTTSSVERKVTFGTVYFEPFVFRKEMIEMSLVFEAGYGKATIDSTSSDGEITTTKTSKQSFVPVGAGVSFNFKIPEIKHLHFLTYMGLNAMAGYRKTVFESDKRANYDGMYWSIGTAIFIDKIFSDAKEKKQRKAAAQKAALSVVN